MGYDGDVIFVLNRCSHRHRARTTTQTRALHQTIAQIAIDVLRTMCGDVDIGRREFAQTVDRLLQPSNTSALERRQNFKRERRALTRLYIINYFHTIRYFFTNGLFHPFCKITKKGGIDQKKRRFLSNLSLICNHRANLARQILKIR